MKSRPGQGLTVISKKIRLKQNDHASRRTQRYPHTRREQHRPSPSPTLAGSSTPAPLTSAPPLPSSPHKAQRPRPPQLTSQNYYPAARAAVAYTIPTQPKYTPTPATQKSQSCS